MVCRGSKTRRGTGRDDHGIDTGYRQPLYLSQRGRADVSKHFPWYFSLEDNAIFGEEYSNNAALGRLVTYTDDVALGFKDRFVYS